MRTLIVDNYDSFTFNLHHVIAQASGQAPIVITNDAPGFRLSSLDDVDCVVISPGPGRPERPADFGICKDIIAAAKTPLLGVCLGHQGLCQLAGGRVVRAPEPYHGRISRIRHAGIDLFEGLPSPLPVVRYHSLIATDVPPEIEVLAWTDDGLIMAVRHRTRPQWGVQFHPESICTPDGPAMVKNFLRLAARWHGDRVRARRPVVVAGGLEGGEPGRSRGGADARFRVVWREVEARVTPEAAFHELFGASEHAFWLDSSQTDRHLGRFSFMGDAAGPYARTVTADVWNGIIRVTSRGKVHERRGSFLDWLEADLAAQAVAAPELPFDFALGWVGYLGYELKVECGGARGHRSRDPDAAMIFADRALAFDHRSGALYFLALAPPGEEDAALAWIADAEARLARASSEGATERAGFLPPIPAGGEIQLRHGRRDYVDLIAGCKDEIAAGETYEVCLTNQASLKTRLDPWAAYRHLRRVSPAPFAAFLRMGELAVLSSSPERFLSVSRDGVVESRPIKGTRARGRTAAEDESLVVDLAGSEKDRAENLMIVDLVRNDLGRCAQAGGVRVDSLFEIERYATVHQMVSTVRADLRPGTSPVACIRAAFPGGSMTGAPKKRTMEIIDRLEGGPRGVYSGALGYISPSGTMDLSIVIRTLVVREAEVDFGVGGAIVALSDPNAEYEETAIKARALATVLGSEFPR
jgi:para-aminobenzoate synthetase